MVKQLHINSETDLARVSEHVEQWGNAAGKTKTSVSVCSLICEELLLHILKSGVHDISLAYKSGRKRGIFPCSGRKMRCLRRQIRRRKVNAIESDSRALFQAERRDSD